MKRFRNIHVRKLPSYQREKLCASPEQTFYRRYYDEKERKGKERKMQEKGDADKRGKVIYGKKT